MVLAHSLKDGRKVWEYTARSLSAYGLAREPDGRIAVLADNGGGGHIILLDAAGAERGRIDPGDAVVVNHMSVGGEPGVFGVALR